LGGVLTVCAITITIGAIREKDDEQADSIPTPRQSSAATATFRPETVEAETSTSESNEVLTLDNNADLASLLTGSDSDWDAGDYRGVGGVGPNFQFRDVNTLDLNLRGASVPDSVGTDDNLHIVAVLTEYEERSNLFFLEPVSTEVR
jgi:hypothetical protein